MNTPEFTGNSAECFPLNPNQVERSLNEIREDPSHALLDVEAAYLEFNNPNLSFLLSRGMLSLPQKEAFAYSEAALTTYKLAREAGTKDGVLPQLSATGRSDLATNMVSVLEGAKIIDPTTPISKVTRNAFEGELICEPSVLEVVRRLADHRIDRDAYYAGASTVMAGLRLALREIRSL